MLNKNRNKEEVKHFSKLEHIWWGAQTHAGQKRYDYKFDLLKKLCRPRIGAKVLEIGCGDGEFTKRLQGLNASIVATDLTPKVISRAKNRYKFKNVKFEVANSQKLPYKANAFDLVCGISILHHVDLIKTLYECKRVLKKGGYIFFTEPNLLNPQIFFGLNLSFLRARMEFSPSESAFFRWGVERTLTKVGFEKFSVANYDFLHPNTPRIFIPLVKDVSDVLEKTPLIKEISGSLYIFAVK